MPSVPAPDPAPAPQLPSPPTGPGEVRSALEAHGYLADEGLATVVFLALAMERPLFLEGDPGVGKTEVAHTLAAALGTDLLRLQCYEGIDLAQAVYDWDYPRQLLHLRAAEAGGGPVEEAGLYQERFLLRRPLLAALDPRPRPPVLLIDEIDRADDEFEAYLLEFLATFSVTIPELGERRAQRAPVVILTSNRTRDVHDALKRRCLYHWIDHPDPEREIAIVARRVPDAPPRLVRAVVGAVGVLRTLELYKPPGVAETIDWARALTRLGATGLDRTAALATLGSVCKHREDLERVRAGGVDAALAGVGEAGTGA